jgi:hypothetical protein
MQAPEREPHPRDSERVTVLADGDYTDLRSRCPPEFIVLQNHFKGFSLALPPRAHQARSHAVLIGADAPAALAVQRYVERYEERGYEGRQIEPKEKNHDHDRDVIPANPHSQPVTPFPAS